MSAGPSCAICMLLLSAVCTTEVHGGMKGAEEGLVIKDGCGAATIHNDKLVVTVSVQGVVRQWSAGWSFARGTSVCKQFGFV